MNPILLTVWAVLTTCFIALLIYRGQLTRYEEDQIFLGDDTNQHEELHDNIVRKVEKIQPFVTLLGASAGLVTACAIGVYVWQAWKVIH